jgi:hypothetical protein
MQLGGLAGLTALTMGLDQQNAQINGTKTRSQGSRAAPTSAKI